jgi:hypothetical protein
MLSWFSPSPIRLIPAGELDIWRQPIPPITTIVFQCGLAVVNGTEDVSGINKYATIVYLIGKREAGDHRKDSTMKSSKALLPPLLQLSFTAQSWSSDWENARTR